MQKTSRLLFAISISGLALVAVYASVPTSLLFRAAIVETSNPVAQDSLDSQIRAICDKYRPVVEYKTPGGDSRLIPIQKVALAIDQSTTQAIEQNLVDLASKAVDFTKAYESIDGSVLSKKESIASNEAKIISETKALEGAKDAIEVQQHKATIDSSRKANETLATEVNNLQKQKADDAGQYARLNNALADLDKNFFGGKLKKDKANATLDNCSVHGQLKKWKDDTDSLFDSVTGALTGLQPFAEGPQMATIDEVSSKAAEVGKLAEQYSQAITNATNVSSALAPFTSGDEKIFSGKNVTLRTELTRKSGELVKAAPTWMKMLESVATSQLTVLKTQLSGATDSNAGALNDSTERVEDFIEQSQSLVTKLSVAASLAGSTKKINLPPVFDELKQQIVITRDWLAGTTEDTIVDQVRLFYYPNAMAIAQSLRPGEDFRLVNPQSEAAQAEANKQKLLLRSLENSILQLSGERNDLQIRLLTIKSDIRKLDGDIKTQSAEVKSIAGISESQGKEIVAKDKQIETLKKALSDAGTDDYKQIKLTSELEAAQKTRDELAEQKKATDKDLSNAESEKTRLQTQRSTLADEQNGLPSKLAATTTALENKTRDLRDARAKLPNLATDEAESFGDYVQNEPIFVARGIRGVGSASLRVRFLVYPRSKIIILRGPRQDVNMVKDMIALFDRPSPQARITLHSLQINGSDPRSISDAMRDISGALRDAKSNMMIVQDTLRNAITAEVARCERTARQFDIRGSVDHGLCFRSQIYSNEVKKELGIKEMNKEDWVIARSLIELQDLEDRISGASADLLAAVEYKGRRDARDTAVERFRLIATRAAYMASTCFKRISQTKYSNCLSYRIHSDCGKKFVEAFNLSYGLVRSRESDPCHICDTLTGEKHDAATDDSRKTKLKALTKELIGFVEDLRTEIQKGFDADRTAIIIKDTKEQAKLESLKIELAKEIGKLKGSDIPAAAQPTPAQWLVDGAPDFLYAITTPDPAKVTTLGEMIFVLSLTNREARERILHDFAEQMYFDCKTNWVATGKKNFSDLFKFAVGTVRQFGNQSFSDPAFKGIESMAPYPLFTHSVFGANTFLDGASDSNWFRVTAFESGKVDSTDEVSSNQLEILYGLRAKVRRNVASELRRCAFYTNSVNPVTDWEKISEGDKEVIKFAERLLGLEAHKMVGQGEATNSSAPDANRNTNRDLDSQYLKHLATRLEESESLSTATPRVAAADMMIKRFMETFETDFDKFFIDPMLAKIREATYRSNISFGGYERKSIIASNRLLTRVETSGTANVQVGDQENILSESATLLSILDSVKIATAPKKTDGKSTASSIASALGDGGIAALAANSRGITDKQALLNYGIGGALLSSLLDQPEPDRGEIYSIGTGGSFKVTPIFNPSGQGLTFRLDYAQAVLIQEPNGTTQLQAPRIDRHTVNTEVQITNLDLGEISSFEANYKIGRGEKRAGGVPILRDIFPTVPIIGWFTKSPKVNPVRQHSLIFAQTAMYPTVGDIMDLLVQNPTGGRFQNSGAPDHSNPKSKADN